MLLDEPTRGIDIGTKAQIYRLIGELAAQGKAIILVSSYLPELMNVCDRIGVMCRGPAARGPGREGLDRRASDAVRDGTTAVEPAASAIRTS